MEKRNYYSAERNVQILVYLLKANGIKNIVASPGATNISFVQSVQNDVYFRVLSAVDERSAAYMAVGLARETNEPVVISCTGATASRNYLPALTEAYYSNLPIIAVTSSQPIGRIGHNVPQVIDRRIIQNDVAKISVELPVVKDGEDEWICQINANKAVLRAFGKDRGPVHINLITTYNMDFSIKEITGVNVIKQHFSMSEGECVTKGRIAILCGTHSPWENDLTVSVDKFCKNYDAIVISDATGNYTGEFGITDSLVFTQEVINRLNDFDLIIHMGGISGTYYNYNIRAKRVWRISPDGEIIDTFRKLTDVFKVPEIEFFNAFNHKSLLKDDKHKENKKEHRVYEWLREEERLKRKTPEIPFSNVWIAMHTVDRIPRYSAVYLGILHSLRAWSMFRFPQMVYAYANTGGFGIDGYISSVLGASLANPSKLYFAVIGDLAFFYDMNTMGNRHVGNNIRLLVINNGCGTEFMNYNHMASVLNDNEKNIIAAQGHFGNKSEKLIRAYAENLGFKYLSARNKQEYLSHVDEFLNENIGDCSIIFEVFTNHEDESEALRIINTLDGANPSVTGESCSVPERFMKMSGMKLILWGTGNCYNKNIESIKTHFKVTCVCDNNKIKWGNEFNGIRCVSPEEVMHIAQAFVVIMVEDISMAFQITNQLMNLGIENFDVYDNWKKYSTLISEKFV